MLNEIMIEGIVARESWVYDKDAFFRIASYRDSDRPVKVEFGGQREEPDYVNIRVPGGVAKMFSPRKGQAVRVFGYLQSRDYKESLGDFLEKARKLGEVPEIQGVDTAKTLIDRNTVEIVATKVIALDNQISNPQIPGKPARKNEGKQERHSIQK